MIILTIRTDKPESGIGLFDGQEKLNYETWQAHRQLAETIHKKLENLLNESSKSWHDVEGVVVFKGPGSFTGLRIGLAVANALAYSLPANIVGTNGDDWIREGIKKLQNGRDEKLVMPEYGAPAHITEPRK